MKIIIIGGGPGGYVAAITAAKLGAEVSIIEKNKFGGTCLNVGCIPTKTYLHATDLLTDCAAAGSFGVTGADNCRIDVNSLYGYKNKIVKQLVGGVEFLLKKNKVSVQKGVGKIIAPGSVEVTQEDGNETILEADAIIIATGSKPILPKMFDYDKNLVLGSDEVLDLTKLPESLVIVGGGVIGCEFGQFFARAGTKVSIVEMKSQLLPNEDAELATILKKSFIADGMDIYTNTSVSAIKKVKDHVIATLSSGEELTAQRLVVAIGRRPATENIWSGIDIAMERGSIVVDDYMRTNIPGVYAIGDVVASPALAHVASREGIVAVRHILSLESVPMNYHAVPRCVYTSPQIASVGMTEQELKQKGIEFHSGRFFFAGLGKSIATGHTEGFVKLLTDENDVVIGASIVGEQATELLSELTLAVELGLTAAQIGSVIHPHPSLSEALMEAAHAVHGLSVHSVS